MPKWIDGYGWEDGLDRYLFTSTEFFRAYWGSFTLGAITGAALMSAIYHWL